MMRIRPDLIIASIAIVTVGLFFLSPVLGALWVGWLLGVWSSMFAMSHPRPEPPTRPRTREDRKSAFAAFVRAVQQASGNRSLRARGRWVDESARDPKPDTDWFPSEQADVGEDEGP